MMDHATSASRDSQVPVRADRGREARRAEILEQSLRLFRPLARYTQQEIERRCRAAGVPATCVSAHDILASVYITASLESESAPLRTGIYPWLRSLVRDEIDAALAMCRRGLSWKGLDARPATDATAVPEAWQEIYLLHHVDGWPLEAIAEVEGRDVAEVARIIALMPGNES